MATIFKTKISQKWLELTARLTVSFPGLSESALSWNIEIQYTPTHLQLQERSCQNSVNGKWQYAITYQGISERSVRLWAAHGTKADGGRNVSHSAGKQRQNPCPWIHSKSFLYEHLPVPSKTKFPGPKSWNSCTVTTVQYSPSLSLELLLAQNKINKKETWASYSSAVKGR